MNGGQRQAVRRGTASRGAWSAATAVRDWTFGGTWPYEPRWFETADGRVAYVDEGEGRPVVLVHGLIPSLAEAGYRIIVPDHLGFGRSDKPAGDADVYRVPRHGDGLEALLESRDLADATPGRPGLGRPDRPRLGDPPPRAGAQPVHPQRLRPPTPHRDAAPTRRATVPGARCRRGDDPGRPPVRPGLLLQAGVVHEERLGVEAGLVEHFGDKPVAFVWPMQDSAFTPGYPDRRLETFPHTEVTRIEEASHYVQEEAHAVVIPRLLELLRR